MKVAAAERKLIEVSRVFCIATVDEMERLVRCLGCLDAVNLRHPSQFMNLHFASRELDIARGELPPRWKRPHSGAIPPVREDHTIPDDAVCQEALHIAGVLPYVLCGEPAVAIVRSHRDKRDYYMCGRCAHANMHRRGCKIVAERTRSGTTTTVPVE